jgi:hypothetical protein
MAECWNAVLERSQAEWTHILHDDDWVEPKIYESFLSDLEGSPPFGIWMCGTTDRYAEDGVTHEVRPPTIQTATPAEIAEVIFEKSMARCASVIMNRALALQLGGFDKRMKHSLDGDLFLRVALAGGACFSSSILGNYRIHPASSTGMGKVFHRGVKRALPVLDDRRLLDDHLIFLSKQDARTLKLSAIRRYSSGLIFGCLRYYLRRGRVGSLIFGMKCFIYHLYVFCVKSHLP